MLSQPWRNKFAIVSGGSSGLGLHLALGLAKQGANLVLIGRDLGKLEAAQHAAKSAGAPDVIILSFDMTDEVSWTGGESDSAERLRDLLESYPIDLLINAVGRSDRGRLEQLQSTDLLQHFQANVLSAFRMTQKCFPGLKKARGTVVNIASLAGVIPAPGMGAYTMAKHALVGMHRQWRLEHVDSPVHFMLVCPGPIDRQDSRDRYDLLVQSRDLAPQQAKPGGGVRLNRLDPEALAERILYGAARRELELIVPSKARWLAALLSLCPSWADTIVRRRFS